MRPQADSRKWMACLYNLFLLMEAKNHENGKETSGPRPDRRHGNVHVLTGCASISSRQVADELEGMLKAANTKATVKAVDDDLAKDAVNGAVKDHAFVTNVNAGVKAKLDTDKNNGKYVWYTYFATKDQKKADKAKKVVEKIVGTGTEGAYVNTAAAVNFTSVKVGDKSGTSIEAGDKFELSMKEFTIGTGKDAVDYVMVVVTCKAVEVSKSASLSSQLSNSLFLR